MVNVFNDRNEVIGQVEYNSNLDFYDGRNYTCGSTGRHKGLAQLEDGRYVLIYGTQWQNERDHAVVITPEEAVQEILKSGNENLFEKFPNLNEVRRKTIAGEASGPVTTTGRLNDVHRAVVRAVMKADGFELVGEFGRVAGEEYGHYVYWNDDSETIMVCSLDEQHGDIEVGKMEDFDGHEHLKEIIAAIDPTRGLRP